MISYYHLIPVFPQLFSPLLCTNMENARNLHLEWEWDKWERRNPSLRNCYKNQQYRSKNNLPIICVIIIKMMNHLHFPLSLQCTLKNDNLFQKWPTFFEYLQQGASHQNANIFKAGSVFSLVWEDKIFQKLLCSIFVALFFFLSQETCFFQKHSW